MAMSLLTGLIPVLQGEGIQGGHQVRRARRPPPSPGIHRRAAGRRAAGGRPGPRHRAPGARQPEVQ
jgi:hypothetical protein